MGITWPNGGTTAFAFGFDLDGDTIWQNKIRQYPGWEDFVKGPSVGLYGPDRGAYRILEIMDEFSFKSTWYIPTDIVEEYPSLVREIAANGHELAHHGWDHREDYGQTFEEQRRYIDRCQKVFEDIAGVRPVTFRPCGALLPETEAWLYQEGGGICISTDVIGDAMEYYTAGGKKTRAVTLPGRVELDDYILTVFNSFPAVLTGMPRISPYRDTLSNFIREVEGAVRFGNSVCTCSHPQVSGSPGRSIILREFCQYLESNPKVWVSTCQDIAEHYRAVVED